MSETTGRNAPQVEEAQKFAKENNVDLRTVEIDVSNQPPWTAIKAIIEQEGRLDVMIHNAGHMVFGPRKPSPPSSSPSSTTSMC